MAVFIVLWPYLLTTKLKSVILHNLGHSNLYELISTFTIIGHSDCEICGKTFTGKNRTRNFERHMKSEHVDKSPKKWICEICNSEFKFRSLLQRHQNASTCRGKYNTKTKIEEMDQ